MASTTPTPTVAGGTIDSESLRRQKEEMGQALSRVQRANTRASQLNGSTPVPSSTAPSVRRSLSLATEHTDAVVAEVNGTNTPQPGDIPKPSVTPAVVEKPTPVEEVEMTRKDSVPAPNGIPQPETPIVPPAPQAPYNQSVVPMERRFRDPVKGKSINTLLVTGCSPIQQGFESALLGSVTYMTNPNVPHDPKWKLNRWAQKMKTQVSGFITLPFNYRNIRVIPHLTAELQSRMRHKMFFIHNLQVYKEPNSREVPGAYEVQLIPGQNILSIEVLADPKAGEKKDYAPPQLQFDFEKNTMIVELGAPPAS